MTAVLQWTRWCGPCCASERGHCSQAHGGSKQHTHTPRLPSLDAPRAADGATTKEQQR